MNEKRNPRGEAGKPAAKAAYEPPVLKKYGSLAELTRSGTGTRMEGGRGPSSRFQ